LSTVAKARQLACGDSPASAAERARLDTAPLIRAPAFVLLLHLVIIARRAVPRLASRRQSVPSSFRLTSDF
jgi:hypothetical protein